MDFTLSPVQTNLELLQLNLNNAGLDQDILIVPAAFEECESSQCAHYNKPIQEEIKRSISGNHGTPVGLDRRGKHRKGKKQSL